MIQDLSKTIVALRGELCREYLEHLLGKKDTLESAVIYQKYAQGFTPSVIKELKKKIAGVEAEKKREQQYIYNYVFGTYLGQASAELSDRSETFQSKAHITVNGEQIPFKKSAFLLAQEKDQKKRKEIYAAGMHVREQIKKDNEELYALNLKLIQEQGYTNFVELLSELHATEYDSLVAKMILFLNKTYESYQKDLGRYLKTIGLKKGEVYSYDVSYLLRGNAFTELFPAEKMETLMIEFLKHLGINLKQQKNLKLHLERGDNKESRAFCMPIDAPSNVQLVLNPIGGLKDYTTFFHEMGHAQHFVNSSPKISYLLRHLGLHSSSEAYSFLFQYLFNNRTFLKHYITKDDSVLDTLLDFARFEKLYMLRRYALKLIYELKFYRNDLRKLDAQFRAQDTKYANKYSNAAEMYAEILGRDGVRYFPVNYLTDFDGGLYSAEYIKAWIFEGQFNRALSKRFGDHWFAKQEAGVFLKEMWSWGESKYIEEYLPYIGADKLSIEPLIEELNQEEK